MTLRKNLVRHPSLSSTGARRALSHRSEQVFEGVCNAIDNLGGLYDGLAAVRANQNPLDTAEARALDYKRQHDAARARAEGVTKAQVDRLIDQQMALERGARVTARIDSDTLGGSEIRSALRAMSAKDRDRAVADAMERQDSATIAAILHAPSPIVTGHLTLPIKALTQQYLEMVNPTLAQDLADVETALTSIGLAWEAFRTSSSDLRDASAEVRGLEGDAKAKEASRALEAAMRGDKTEAA